MFEKFSLARRGGGMLRFIGKRGGQGSEERRVRSDGRKKRKRESGKVQRVTCPVCTRDFPAEFVQLHAAECNGSKRNDERVKSDCAVGAVKKSVARNGTGGKSAFGVMMHAASLRPRSEHFVCDLFAVGDDDDKVKRCIGACWQAESGGRKCPASTTSWAWCSSIDLLKEVQFNGGQYQGSRVRLCTNFRPIDQDQIGPALAFAVGTFPFYRQALSPFLPTWRKGLSATRLSPGVLKSLLQKSVRRNLGCATLFCAVELMLVDYHAFLRRMPIIVLEDSILHPEFDLFVWLLLANVKGYVPGVSLLCRCLRVTLQVAMIKTQDCIGFGPADPSDETSSDGQGLFDEIEDFADSGLKSDPRAYCLLRAILCRASFGGMKGDMRMLYRHAAVWSERFSHKGEAWVESLIKAHEECCRVLLEPPNESNKELFDLVVPLAGIDFHCRPAIVDALEKHCIAQGLDGADPTAIRSAMWVFHSSVNHRTFLTSAGFFVGLQTEEQVEADRAFVNCSDTARAEKEARLQPLWGHIESTCQTFCRQFLQEKCREWLPEGLRFQSSGKKV